MSIMADIFTVILTRGGETCVTERDTVVTVSCLEVGRLHYKLPDLFYDGCHLSI